MPVVRASLKLFGGDTVVVRCSNNCHIQLVCDSESRSASQEDNLSVRNCRSAYIAVPWSGTWKVLIDSHSQSLEHSISFVAA